MIDCTAFRTEIESRIRRLLVSSPSDRLDSAERSGNFGRGSSLTLLSFCWLSPFSFGQELDLSNKRRGSLSCDPKSETSPLSLCSVLPATGCCCRGRNTGTSTLSLSLSEAGYNHGNITRRSPTLLFLLAPLVHLLTSDLGCALALLLELDMILAQRGRLTICRRITGSLFHLPLPPPSSSSHDVFGFHCVFCRSQVRHFNGSKEGPSCEVRKNC